MIIKRASLRNKIIAGIGDDTVLPAFSMVLQKVNTLLANPDVDIDDIAKVVAMDPGLTAKFLRLANSAAFSSGETITNLSTAMVRIGLFDIKKMAVASGVLSAFVSRRVTVEWNKFWLHTLLTARTTEALASAYTNPTGKEYMAGLLHNLGLIFIKQYYPAEFEMIAIRTVKNRENSPDVQIEILDIAFADISALICEKWKLDPDIATVIRYQENPAILPANDPKMPRLMAICLNLASTLSRAIVSDAFDSTVINFTSFENLPGWQLLQRYTPLKELELDLQQEASNAEAILSSLGTP